MSGMGLYFCQRRPTSEAEVGNSKGVFAADPNDRNSPFPGRRGNGSNGIGFLDQMTWFF